MTCHERLSHAIQIDKVKIYPNQRAVIERSYTRPVTEDHSQRFGNKKLFNKYHSEDMNKGASLKYDEKDYHDDEMEKNEQNWYFVLADCDGNLEVFKDELSKKEHLLGLYDFLHDEDDDEIS